MRAWIASYERQGIADMGACTDAEVIAAAKHYEPCEGVFFTTYRNIRLTTGERGVFRLHHHPIGSPHCARSAPMSTVVRGDAVTMAAPQLAPYVDAARTRARAAAAAAVP